MTITLKNRLGEPIDSNELLECFDCYLICWEVRDYDCSWHWGDSLDKPEHFEVLNFTMNFVETMTKLNDTWNLLLWLVIMLTFGSLTNSAPWPEWHVSKRASCSFSCTDGFRNFETLSLIGFSFASSSSPVEWHKRDSELTSLSISAMIWLLTVGRTLCALDLPTEE